MKKLLCLLFLCLTFSSSAGLLIEPYLGYAVLGSGDTTLNGSRLEHSYNGVVMGGRLGYSYSLLMAGIDYSMETFSLESKRGSIEVDDDMNKSQLGIFIGADLPLIRAWGTYYLSSKMKGKDSIQSSNQVFNTTDKFSDGSGYGLGVSVSFLPFIALNLEYRMIEYDKYEINGVSAGSAYSEKTNLNTILLSISAPFDI